MITGDANVPGTFARRSSWCARAERGDAGTAIRGDKSEAPRLTGGEAAEARSKRGNTGGGELVAALGREKSTARAKPGRRDLDELLVASDSDVAHLHFTRARLHDGGPARAERSGSTDGVGEPPAIVPDFRRIHPDRPNPLPNPS